VHVSVKCPPANKKFKLCVWNSASDYENDVKPSKDIELLKVYGVHADPRHDDVFVIEYATDQKSGHRKTMTFQMVDRHRDVWVEMLLLQIKAARAEKVSRNAAKTQTKR